MKRRVRVLPPGYLVGTKGHSVLRRKTYTRKPLVEVEEFYSHTMPTSRRHELDSGYTVGSYHNATNFSNAVMDDSYDLQHQSRGRDHRLLNTMNSALVSTDFSRSPKSVVAVLRATRRPTSLRTTRHLKTTEVPDTGPYYLSSAAGYIPGRTKRLIALSSYIPRVSVDYDEYADLYPRSTKYRPSDPVYIKRRAAARSFYPDTYYLPWYTGWRAVARGRYLRSRPRIYYGRTYPLTHLPYQALLVGEDKLDDPDRPRIRKPRTRYYADKLQKVDKKEHLSSFMATPTPHSIAVKATKPLSKPALPTYSWRPIRYVDDYVAPSNLMSWQHRLESRLDPEDLISRPSNYGKMRDQVRDVQDKLDHHRQLMDRHADRAGADAGLATGGGLSAGRTTDEGGAGGDGLGKVSPLRKKLRKVICKSRHDPSYYDE